MEQVDPKLYGLPPRTVLMKQSPEEFILVINRKSRIIMKDALTILKKVEKIKEKIQGASVVLETNAPVCSKSIKFLEEKDVDVLKSV
ncbi:MAG: hypothetical protein K8S18_11930 [Desulfobacula sp.]|nr:hypothetical protein [Desulfobacula sp.]